MTTESKWKSGAGALVFCFVIVLFVIVGSRTQSEKIGFANPVAQPYVLNTVPGAQSATNTAFIGNVSPQINNTQDLGSPDLSWRNVYASGTIATGISTSTQSFVSTTSTSAVFVVGSLGTLHSPSLTFAGATDKGMFGNTSNQLDFVAPSAVQFTAGNSSYSFNTGDFSSAAQRDFGKSTSLWGNAFLSGYVSSSRFIAATGTALQPSYMFNGSTGTGLYQNVSGIVAPTLDFSVNGTQGASLQAGGNFSVLGSAADLQCSTSNATCTIGQSNGATGKTVFISGSTDKFQTWNPTAGAFQTRMTILGNQVATSVGINNDAPTAMLDVGGTVSSTQFIVATGTVGAPGIVFNSGIGNTGIYQGTASNPNPTMDFALIGADNMTLATGGNLAVIGSSANFQCVTTNATCTLGAIQGQTGITNIQSGTINLVTSNGVAGGFQKRLTILGNQYATSVGINESAPVAMLDVAGQTSSTSFFVDVEGTTSTFRGTSTTQATVGMQANPITDNTVCITAGGVLVQEATNCTVSSIRFKEHVKSLDAKTLLDEVKRLRAVSYDYKPDMGHGTLSTSADQGFIAEEVASIDPYLVVWEEGTPEELALIKGLYPDAVLNGHLIPKTVDYAKISVLLTGAVQAQQDQVTALTSRMDKVEHRVGLLERIVSWLKSLFKK